MPIRILDTDLVYPGQPDPIGFALHPVHHRADTTRYVIWLDATHAHHDARLGDHMVPRLAIHIDLAGGGRGCVCDQH